MNLLQGIVDAGRTTKSWYFHSFKNAFIKTFIVNPTIAYPTLVAVLLCARLFTQAAKFQVFDDSRRIRFSLNP